MYYGSATILCYCCCCCFYPVPTVILFTFCSSVSTSCFVYSRFMFYVERMKKGSKNKQKGEHGKKVVTAVVYMPWESVAFLYGFFFYFFLHIHHLNAQFLNICAVRFFSIKIVSFLDTFRVQWNFYSHGNVRLVRDIYRQHERQRATSTVVIQCTHIILMGSHSARKTWICLPKNAFYARQTECARSSYIKSLIYSSFMDFGWALCGQYFHDIPIR